MRPLGNGQVICSLPWRTSGFRFWTGRVWVLPLCQPQGKYFLLRTGVSKKRFIFILMFHFWNRVTSIMGQQATKLDAGKKCPEASRCAHQAHCIMVSVQRILGGRLRVKWAGGFTSVGTAKYSDLSGTHPGVWGMALFLFAYGILGADSLSEPPSSPALSWPPLWLVQTHAEKSGPAWGSRAGTAETQGLLCSPWTKQPGGQSSRQHPQSPRLRGGFQQTRKA